MSTLIGYWNLNVPGSASAHPREALFLAGRQLHRQQITVISCLTFELITSITSLQAYLHTFSSLRRPFTAPGPPHYLHHDQYNQRYDGPERTRLSALSVQSPDMGRHVPDSTG